MAAIFFLIIIIVLSKLHADYFDQSIVKCCEVVLLEIVTILYISGIIGKLIYGVFLVILLAIGFFAYQLYKFIKNKAGWCNHFGFGEIVYFLIIIGFFLINRGVKLINGDEFTHWGTTVKIMFQTDYFSNEPGTALYFVDYPPGTALLQYFLVKIDGVCGKTCCTLLSAYFW